MRKLRAHIKRLGRELGKNRLVSIGLLSLVAVLLLIPLHQARANFWDIADSASKIITIPYNLLFLPLAAAVMALAGKMLDICILFSLHTGYIFTLSPAINMGWAIIRDICNMFFIFILIYISIGTILKGSGFQTKKLLTQVIIAALLINFSLFATKAVIDVSNIFGNWLYGGIQKTLAVNSAAGSESVSLSGLIADRLGILKFWASGQSADQKGVADILSDDSAGFIATSMKFVLVLMTTYIFAYCAVLFLARSITLLFLLVFSPLGFMGSILPKLAPYAKEWRDELGNAAIFPISFLLVLYIALQFINSLKDIAPALQNVSGDVYIGGMKTGLYFQYFLIIFLLYSCLKIAKDNSGKMGKALGGLASQLGSLAVSASTGVAGVALRASVGRGAAALTNNATFQDFASGKRGNFATQLFARQGLKATSGVSKSSFDIRGTGALKSVGIEGGKPVKSYVDVKKDIEKEEKAFSALLGKGKEGEARRVAYGRTVGSRIWYNVTGSGALAAKVGEDVTEAGYKGYTKAETEGARKKAQTIKNQIINNEIGTDSLNKAVGDVTADTGKLDATVKKVIIDLEREKAAKIEAGKKVKDYNESEDTKDHNEAINKLKDALIANTNDVKRKSMAEASTIMTKQIIGNEINTDKDGKKLPGNGLKFALKEERRKVKKIQDENKVVSGEEKGEEKEKGDGGGDKDKKDK